MLQPVLWSDQAPMRPGSLTIEPLTESDRALLAAGDIAPAALTEAERALLEKSSGDHFFGAWKGGKAKSGGEPAGGAPIPHTDGVDNHENIPKKADPKSLLQFATTRIGDRVESIVAVSKKRGQSVRGVITGRTADSLTVDADGARVTVGKDAVRHLRITRAVPLAGSDVFGPKKGVTLTPAQAAASRKAQAGIAPMKGVHPADRHLFLTREAAYVAFLTEAGYL